MKKLITLVAAMAMVATFAMTAAAAEWDFFGSARVSTTWTDTETIGSSAASVDNFAEALQGNSRIGATVKVSDELTGGFEYGTGVNVRKLYGEWNFGPGTFLVGQTYTPLNMFYSNQIYGSDTDLLGYGGVYSGRAAMLRLKFGGLQIALVPAASDGLTNGLVDGAVVAASKLEADEETATAQETWTYNLETDDFGTAENSFPAIEAKYSHSFGNFNLAVAGGYQTWDLSNTAGTTIDIDSWVVAVGGSVKLGVAYINANVYAGQNSGHMIWMDVNGATTDTSGLATYDGTKVLNNECRGFLLVAGAKINDMFSVEFGYAGVQTELDDNTSDDAASYYGQATVTLAPGVFFVPEIGVIDYDETGQKETTYAAVKWQINF